MKKVLILLLVLLAAFSILSAVELQLKEIEGISIAPQNNRGEVEVDYCGTFNGKIIGTNEAGTLYAAARFTPTELANYVGDSFQQIKFIVINTATDVTVRIFEGATAFTVGQMLYEGHVEDLVTVDWCTHELASSVAIEEGKDYWIVYEVTCTGGYPLAADDGPAIAGKGDLISMDGIAWESIKTEYNLNQNFMVTAVVQNNPAENDMNALGIIGLSGNVEADKALIPELKVKNYGTNEATFSADLVIKDVEGTLVYEETSADITLAVGKSSNIEMAVFTPEAGKYYTAESAVVMATDDDQSNNTQSVNFTTYTIGKEYVVAEVGTGIWCSYCPGVAMAMDQFHENGDKLAIIEYHDGDEDKYKTPFSTGRLGYYEVETFPITIFDGVTIYNGGHPNENIYSALFPLYQERATMKTPLTIAVRKATRDNYSMNVSVTKEAQMPKGNYVLQVAVNESGISESWFGQSEVNFVNRVMVPNHKGTALNFVDGVATVEINFFDEVAWVNENCEVVFFVQNNDTKEIFQATKLGLGETSANEDATMVELNLSNYPNPFNPETTISFNLASESQVSLEIFNAKGQKVNTLLNGEVKSAGLHNIVWNGTNSRGNGVNSGVYFYKVKGGKFTSTKKMILLK